MNNLERWVIHCILRKFCDEFSHELNRFKDTLSALNRNVSPSLPEVFKGKSFSAETVYSIDKKHVMIILSKSDQFQFSSHVLYGDVINYFDKTGLWWDPQTPVAMEIGNSTNESIKDSFLKGVKPFRVTGSQAELFIERLNLDVPGEGRREIPYIFVFSYEIFTNRLDEIPEFVFHFIHSYWNFYHQNRTKFTSNGRKAVVYKKKLENIMEQMDYYFFHEDIKELEIDKFIEDNPVILEHGLGLIQPLHQVILDDVLGKYGQKLKPDLIAYNPIKKVWTIVDYKLGRGSNLVKDPGGVRTKFYEDVNKLLAQLRIYRKYFDEHAHREYFFKKYGHKIDENPPTIGVIGFVTDESRKDFNELLDETFPRWCEIIPYNDLYNRFARFIETLNKIQ